jgi:glutamate/tyrosine decarboxylase-like PLP-dependent enzyme
VTTNNDDPITIMADAAARAGAYLGTLAERPVAPSAGAIGALDRLGGPLPGTGEPAADVLALLDAVGSAATVATAGPRYFGFVIGGALPASLGASVLATAWDQNAGYFGMSPVAARCEEFALEWLVTMLGLPGGTGGAFVTGATMANVTALITARDAVLAREGWDVAADGLNGAPPLRVVVGAEVHASVRKALALIGLGRDAATVVPADDEGRMRADAFPAIDGATIVCLQAGNVNSGASDPFDDLVDRAHEAGAWVHVDGAFGLWAAAAPHRAHLVHGVQRADSWATDFHKWLNVPYDSGIALVRDGDALLRSMAMSAAYLPVSGERDPDAFTPESSRRARGVEVWAALRSLGRDGAADLVERCCRHATRFADRLAAAGYDILNDVVLNQVVVAFGDDDTTGKVVAGVQADGTCWCGPTTWRGRAGMRISVSSWATTADDVERSADAIIRVARSLA